MLSAQGLFSDLQSREDAWKVEMKANIKTTRSSQRPLQCGAPSTTIRHDPFEDLCSEVRPLSFDSTSHLLEAKFLVQKRHISVSPTLCQLISSVFHQNPPFSYDCSNVHSTKYILSIRGGVNQTLQIVLDKAGQNR